MREEEKEEKRVRKRGRKRGREEEREGGECVRRGGREEEREGEEGGFSPIGPAMVREQGSPTPSPPSYLPPLPPHLHVCAFIHCPSPLPPPTPPPSPGL